jgi:hypothetical protein
LLRDSQIGFLDHTGNVELRLRKPALYIRAEGSPTDPDPKPSSGPTLRGPRVGALMRTLIEVTPPYTAGDLSSALGIDDGYVSPAEGEALIKWMPAGPITLADNVSAELRPIQPARIFRGLNAELVHPTQAGHRLRRSHRYQRARRYEPP